MVHCGGFSEEESVCEFWSWMGFIGGWVGVLMTVVHSVLSLYVEKDWATDFLAFLIFRSYFPVFCGRERE